MTGFHCVKKWIDCLRDNCKISGKKEKEDTTDLKRSGRIVRNRHAVPREFAASRIIKRTTTDLKPIWHCNYMYSESL